MSPFKLLLYVMPFFSIASCIQYKPHPVKTNVPAEWKQTPPAVKKNTAPQSVNINTWWHSFQDKELDALEEKALATNPTIQDRILRLEEVKALYIVARAPIFPTIDIFSSATRQHLPKSVIPTQKAASPTAPTAGPPTSSITGSTIPTTTPPIATTTQEFSRNQSFLQVLPELSYEIDFWGKYNQKAKAAAEQIKESSEDILVATLMTTSEVAKRYFEIRTYDAELSLLQSLYSLQKEQVFLLFQRIGSGIDNEAEYRIALAQLAATDVSIETIKYDRAIAENTLATLIGVNASDLTIAPHSKILYLPAVSVGIPSSILEKRPDVRRAVDAIEEKRLSVGVAEAELFPAITLYGNTGFQSKTRASLFKWKNHVLLGTAALLAPIYNAGSLNAQVEAAISRYKQAVNSYIERTLIAFEEVENALTQVVSASHVVQFSKEALKERLAKSSLSTERYDTGVFNFLETVQDKINTLTARQRLVEAERGQLLATVDLIRSIGGSWETSD